MPRRGVPASWPRGSIACSAHGQDYVDQRAAAYEKSYWEARIHRLRQTANQLGYQN